MSKGSPLVTFDLIQAEREVLERRLMAGLVLSEGCWEWMGVRRNGNHGALSIHDRPYYVHRLAFQLFVGEIPDGMYVCHHCDNPPCARPDHLFLGTPADNVHDMEGKGRARKVSPRGIANNKATLTDGQVAEMRAMHAAGRTQREIARRFGCSQSTVWRVAHGATRVVLS